MTADARAAAFDAVAGDYDATWGTNPSGLMFRHVYQERLAATFAPGARVLDLGCGTGEDAVFLATRGVTVHAIDVSAAMLAQARAKAEAAGFAGRITFSRVAIEELAALEGTWDGAISNFGALNAADVRAAAPDLAQRLRSGAPVFFCVMGPRPLPETLRRAMTGRGERRSDAEARVGGHKIPVSYWDAAGLQEALGPEFTWSRVSALGVCLPAPGARDWTERYPQTFGWLAMAERMVRAWPWFRDRGDHFLLEGVRA